MAVTLQTLVAFLADELAIAGAEIAPDTPLFSSGLVDSFCLVSLLSHLEAEGGFMIDPTDVTLENFDSLRAILAYVERQVQTQSLDAAS